MTLSLRRASRLAPPLTGNNVESIARSLSTGIACTRGGTVLVDVHKDGPPTTIRDADDGGVDKVVTGGGVASSAAGPTAPAAPPGAYRGFSRAVIVVTLPANAPQAAERNLRVRAAVGRLQMEHLPVVVCEYPELTQAMVCYDSMHPSSIGYQSLAEAILPLLELAVARVEAAMALAPAADRFWWYDAKAAADAMRKLSRHSPSSYRAPGGGLGSEVSPSIGRRSAWLTGDESVPEIRADVSGANGLKGAMAMLLESRGSDGPL